MTVPDIHRGVLENLLDGVLVVGSGGRIDALNPSAERILGLEPGEADGCGFAELFVARDGFDELTQLILDATAPGADPERRVVEIRRGGEPRSLSVATSYLREAGENGASSVIAVFSDISELRELRETELRLAKAAEEQHGKLQSAYREIEDRNQALAAALRKVRVVQGLGMVLTIGVFLGAGLWTWRPLDLFAAGSFLWGEAEATQAENEGDRAPRTVTVTPGRVSTSITLKGNLAPWREATVKSPASGTVTAVRARPGDSVARGQVLVKLDLSREERTYRSKRLAFVRAQEKLETLKNWEKSRTMIKARRSFAKARMNMDSQRSKMRKSRFLFEQGLLAASAFEDQERQYKSQLLDHQTAQEELESVRARADEKAMAAARLALENARAQMLTAREALEENAVRAPFAGTLLPPLRAGTDLVEGAALKKGAALFRIADFSRIAAATRADEIDVIKLRVGQKVIVTGNGFPGLKLPGVVDRVSAEADPKRKRNPVFAVFVLLDRLTPAVQARTRPGMSAKLRIVTYDNPKALTVPLDAVRRRAGKHWLKVLDPDSGKVAERSVRIGPTTLSRVEIESGLKAGERVVLSGG